MVIKRSTFIKMFIFQGLLALLCSVQAFAQGHPALDKIIKDGTITVGVQGTVKPISYVDLSSGEVVGFTPELMRLYGKELGVKVVIKDFAWSGLFPALLSGKIDVIAANVGTTMPRTAAIEYTIPWIITGASYAVSKDSNIQNAEGLNSGDVTFGLIKGSIYVAEVKSRFPKAAIKEYDSTSDLTMALLTGRVNVILNDSLVINYTVVPQNPDKIRVLPGEVMRQGYRFAARPGETDLAKSLDIFLQHIRINGEYAKLYQKWMGRAWEPTAVTY